MDRKSFVGFLRRRWVRVTGITLLVLVLAFFAGGGWYFSSLIRSDALLVKEEGPPDYDLEVVDSTDTVLTFALGSDPPDDLLSGETLGVAWDGGYGQVGAIVSRDDTSIARSYTSISGVPPPGVMVALEGDAFPKDPAARGLAHQDVVFEAGLGEFPAWFFAGDDSTWVVFVHGRGAHRREALRALPIYVDRGHPCLVISYRNDTEAPEASGRLARFGATEWEDLEGAVSYALAHGAEDVILVGYSMGGAVVASFLLESDLAGSVQGVVLEAPALHLGIMVDTEAGETNLPLLPIKVPMALTVTAKWFATWRFGVDWPALDYIGEADRFTTPMLVIHGVDDDSVPFEIAERLAEARPDLVTLAAFEGTRHVRAWNVDPDRFRTEIEKFLDGLE
jgi:pimeloyl-ACP methyl ester carboxylesterase